MKIIWTKHAEGRQKEWAKKRGVTRQEVETLLMNPEQIVPGDQDALVAQVKRKGGLLRVPFCRDRGETQDSHGILDKQSTEILEGGGKCGFDMIQKLMCYY